MNDCDSHLECGSIRFSPTGISEIVDGRPSYSVIRSDVLHIALREGILARRPVIQGMVALFCLPFALVPVLHALSVLLYGGTLYFIMGGFFIPAALGAWLLYDLRSRGFFLDVSTKRGHVKLAFRGEVDKGELLEFLQALQKCGWIVQI